MAHLDLLRSVPFLSTVHADDLKALATHAEVLPFRAGDEILPQGKPNQSLYIVAEGTLHASRMQRGRRLMLGRLNPGSVFGELSAFDPGPTTGGVRAVTDGSVLRIQRSALDAFAASHPAAGVEIYRRLLEQVAHRLRETDQRVSDLVSWGKLEPTH